MSFNASWAPQESAQAILGEKLVLEGTFLGCVTYGVLLLLFIQTAFLILSERHKNRQTWFRFIYVFALFACGTIGVASGIKTAELGYIDNRNIPGGPNAFGEEFWAIPVTTMGFVAFIVAVWLQDGYLLYRFLIIWNRNWLIFVIPLLMYLGTIGLSTVLLVLDTQPGSSLWNANSMKLFTAFWSLSISLNVLLTGLIAGRLFFLKSRIKQVLGVAHSQMYTSISALLIESAALYSVFAIIYVVMYALKSNAQNIVIPILTLVESIAPMLISYRVASGRAFTAEATSLSTDIVFATATKPKPPKYPSSGQYNSTAVESYDMHGRSFHSTDSRGEKDVGDINQGGDHAVELRHIRHPNVHGRRSEGDYLDVV